MPVTTNSTALTISKSAIYHMSSAYSDSVNCEKKKNETEIKP